MKPLGLLIFLAILCARAFSQTPVFQPDGLSIRDTALVRKAGYHWGKTYLQIISEYQSGSVNYHGTTATASRLVSAKIYLVNAAGTPTPGESLAKALGMDMTYNSFGWCLLGTPIWLSDPQPLLDKAYSPCRKEEATVAILYAVNGIDDEGRRILQPVFAAKVNKDGTVSFKPGVWALEEHVPATSMQQDNNYNQLIYYKRKL